MKSLKASITLIKINYLLILLILIVSSCSSYINYIENLTMPEIVYKQPKAKKTFCEKNPTHNIVHSSSFTIDDLNKVFKSNPRLSFEEKAMLLTFYQFHARPEATDWTSRTQVHVKINEKEYHHDFGPPHKFPLFDALKTLEKEKIFTKKLDFFLKLSNQLLPRKIAIQENFQVFLDENKESYSEDKRILESYFKLGKPLQKGETFYRHNLKLLKGYESTLPITQEYSLGKNFTCSFDANLYKKGIFLINNKKDYENYFGLLDNSGNYIFFITKKIKANTNSYIGQEFNGTTSPSISPFCVSKDRKKEMILMSLNSRDPGQLLYHLYNYNIQEIDNISEITNFINFPRHQFLTNPSRLLYESSKGSEEQLRYFLSLDFPVYHVENLGAIFGIWNISNQNNTFISDERMDVNQSCLLK
ncbi:MAG: hypothetical protein K9K67_11170 [Bacteriovoracaceae bacterium]|nr:hypothetical protein [Bacteriovoracaceae bacterium]